MKPIRFLYFAVAISIAGQALGQAPKPPVPKELPQPKQQAVSKPVPLGGVPKPAKLKPVPLNVAPKPTPPKAKPPAASKPVPLGQATKPKTKPSRKPATSLKPRRTLKSFPRKQKKLNLIGGDQIMLVGDGLIEQMQKYGYLEYRLTVQNQGKSLHFRNIGWTGDTPAGIARDGLGTRQAGHEPANEGWLQLQKQIAEIKPSVAIIGYGMASSLYVSSLEKFKADYQTLIANIKANAQKKNPLRLVFLAPIARDLGGKLPDGEEHNIALEKYRGIGDLAAEHDLVCRFVPVSKTPSGFIRAAVDARRNSS